jgi:glutamine synthetase
MEGAGFYVESAKGECNLGQHEIAFRYADALTTCDNHVTYKEGAKEIAAQEGMALTFMAKFNEREGNSCHIHISVRGNGNGRPNDELVMVDSDDAHSLSQLGQHFVAGQLAHLRELTLLSAPNINSYKRFVPGSFAPTTVAWGRDNRTCSIRLVGHGPALRIENRVPGGDINPYLATAALVAAGIDGIERELELEPALVGNAYNADVGKVPHTMNDALELWEASDFARDAFGDEVVAHYANMARVELAAYNSTVTDWERRRNFERF